MHEHFRIYKVAQWVAHDAHWPADLVVRVEMSTNETGSGRVSIITGCSGVGRIENKTFLMNEI